MTSGAAFIYSIRENGQRVATIMLVAENGKPKIGGASGVSNAGVPKDIMTAVRGWLRGQQIIQPPKPKERDEIVPLWQGECPPPASYMADYQAADLARLDDEIPF